MQANPTVNMFEERAEAASHANVERNANNNDDGDGNANIEDTSNNNVDDGVCDGEPFAAPIDAGGNNAAGANEEDENMAEGLGAGAVDP